jgi:hypothetical protein
MLKVKLSLRHLQHCRGCVRLAGDPAARRSSAPSGAGHASAAAPVTGKLETGRAILSLGNADRSGPENEQKSFAKSTVPKISSKWSHDFFSVSWRSEAHFQAQQLRLYLSRLKFALAKVKVFVPAS